MSRRTEEEASVAGAEAFRGALFGAAKVKQKPLQVCIRNPPLLWGLIAGTLGAAGYFISPIYRSLTVQFKVYIQLSGMTFGGWIEADRRLRAYEFRARAERKRRDDEAVWKRWEGMIEQQERGEREQKREKG